MRRVDVFGLLAMIWLAAGYVELRGGGGAIVLGVFFAVACLYYEWKERRR